MVIKPSAAADNFSACTTATPCSSISAAHPLPPGIYPIEEVEQSSAADSAGGCPISTLRVQKYIGAALLLFNALYPTVLCLFSAPFALLLLQLAPFSLAYAFSLIFAFFGLRLLRPWLLCPFLITTIPLVLVPLLISALFISHHLCLLSFHPNSSSLFSVLPFQNSECPPDVVLSHGSGRPLRIAPRSLLTLFVLVLIFLEKFAEFLFFYHLKRKIALWRKREEMMEEEAGGWNGREGRGGGGKRRGGRKWKKKKKGQRGMSNIGRKGRVEEEEDDEQGMDDGEEESEGMEEEEDTVYDNGFHRAKKLKGQLRNSEQEVAPTPKRSSPVPISNTSTRVIA